MSSAASPDRIFLAVLPDTEAAAHIFRLGNALKRAHRLSGKVIAPDRLHVSLLFLGSLEANDDFAMSLDDRTGLAIPAFDVCFDRTATFGNQPGKRPFVLFGGDANRGLTALRRELGVRFELKREANRPFEPHVTLLYDRRHVEEYPLGEPIAWRVNEIVLIRSRNGHAHIAKWRLAKA